ncbi:hypothetical protein [Streptoalloteichus hindustanus]|uniref:Uncharacterized protein n=1 Tax=Streptoalloteichus hindustanus TaxID=2017 RepID=A0A1M5BMS8_STRHI|nr:hypothetical protein [Streptoalloteichus hindustanus]SHF43502.1 hypothetical protein SAMN05444320_103631 [Streptoalloteichus hindustanus]
MTGAADGSGRATGRGVGELLVGASLGALVAGLLEMLIRHALVGRLAAALGHADLRRLSLRLGDWDVAYGAPLVAAAGLVLFALVTLGAIRVVRRVARALSVAGASAEAASPPN